jgi:hypothetical protein
MGRISLVEETLDNTTSSPERVGPQSEVLGLIEGIARQIIPAECNPTPNAPNVNFHGGLILRSVKVDVICWGGWWLMNPAFFTHIQHAVATILSSGYMDELQQYGGIGKGRLGGFTIVKTSIGDSPAEPPPIFKKADIENLIRNLIQSKTVADPQADSESLYCVFFPPGCSFTASSTVGAHDCFSMGPTTVFYMWTTNDGNFDQHNSIPKIFSHELVEACTDPEVERHPGWIHDKNEANINDEIADLCEDCYGKVNGITMQYYWSQRHRACVLPPSH